MSNIKKAIVAIILICACIFILTGCEKNQDNTAIDNQVKDTENAVSTNEERYEEVISNYKKALSEYDLDNLESDEEIEKKYDIKDTTLLMHITRYAQDGVKLTHAFYDIDKNGIDELILGAENAIAVVYSFDKEANKPVFIFALDSIERGYMSIYDNGIISSGGSGGAALHMYELGRIKDGTSYELLVKTEEEYYERIDTAIYTDIQTGKKIEAETLQEITDPYIKDAKEVTIEWAK